MQRYTVCRRELKSSFALRWITSKRNEVRYAFFSKRFVVLSMSEKVFAKVAYGTLNHV